MEPESQKATCPICNQELSKSFTASCDYRKPVSNKSYNVYWCSACDYGQVWPRPTKNEVSGFYDLADYYTHKANTNSKVGGKRDESFLERLRLYIAYRLDNGEDLSPNDAISLLKRSSLSMLEIGCGNGETMSRFLAQGFSVVGVEPDPKAREAVKDSELIIYKGTAEELPGTVLGRKYDVILMSHVLEHCLDINSAVINAKNLLKDEGCFIIETPNCASFGFKEQRATWP
ncbi:class I SAM-dependent methyltransferase [Trichothermofontia sp.]